MSEAIARVKSIMLYCYNCGRITLGEPRFCNFCGRSYDIKLCHRLHPNPREAQVCSECGSRDLTMPQPKVPFLLRAILFMLSILPGIALLAVSVSFLAADIYILFVQPALDLDFF